MMAATVQNAVFGFETCGTSPLNLDIFPNPLYLPSATTGKELGPKQVTSVEVDKNMVRNDESPHSNNEKINS